MRKLISLLLLVLPFLCFGQVTLAVDEVDGNGSVTKITYYSKDAFKSENTKGYLSLAAGRIDSLYFIEVLITDDLGCLSLNDGKCMITFDNEVTYEFTQASGTYCGQSLNARYALCKKEELDLPSIYQIMRQNLDSLFGRKIEKIRIYGTKNYNDYVTNRKFKGSDPEDLFIIHFHVIQ